MTRTRPPQPQVSVIVPVYNQEQYLEECISSIRRQTLAEWECIIVNDGSSDSSGEIARRFSEEDSRIRCFEQENRGVSSARNLGMRHASGRYLCFVDGDDFIDAAFLKHLLDASDRGASDLTVAGKLFCDRFPPDKIPALPTCGIFLRREFPLKNNLEFPEGIHPCEDGLFSHFVLALTEKISFCPEAVYHYRQHEQGNHHQIRKRTADILPMIPRWLSLIEEFYEQRHLWKRKAGHLVRFIEHEPFELRLLGMPFSPPEQEILYSIIRDFLTAHCTAAECRRASLHLPFRLWKPHHMNMMIRGSANSITSGFPFPLKEALPPGLSASPVFPPACVPCSPLPNILISGRKNGTGSIPVSRLLPAAIPISRDIFRRNNTSSTAGNSFAGNSV